MPSPGAEPPVPPPPSRLGHFIQTYSGFLSSFVIGVAGLVATSIWQYRQSLTAVHQAESEQAIARTKADNDWRIARAEILAKNLSILASQGADTADQRFGVLLSLTRGSILDPELAVSYALELGKVNPDYMRSVLGSTTHKNYVQLEHAFALTCLQRFGVERAAAICKDDKLADRSDAIAQVIEDELEASAGAGQAQEGPLGLMKEEREVQARPSLLMWLFEPYLQDRYERRQWNEIAAFEASSTGSRLIAALVLATARTGELVTNVEQTELVKFHAERRKWLASYLIGRSCDPECRAKVLDVMLSTYGEAQGDYDEVMQKLVQLPRAETGPTLGQLHARLLWCQVDGDDLAEFRDHVLVPAFARVLADPQADRTMVEDIAGLVALVPAPTDPGAGTIKLGSLGGLAARPSRGPRDGLPEPATAPPADPERVKAFTAWKAMMAAADKNGAASRAFTLRRAAAKRERASPPPMLKKVSFCNAAETESRASVTP